jgi:DNA-binding MarR family transcriptional regulator
MLEKKDLLELQILEQIEKEGAFTQRDLAKRLRVALGLSNAYIRRLVEKGCVMVSTMPKKRVFYNLTPKGILEKSRLTLLYMGDSLDYYRKLRETIGDTLESLQHQGASRIVILGTGEIAEIVFIMARHRQMQLVAVVELEPKTELFLGLTVQGPERLREEDFDAIIVAHDLTGAADSLARVTLEKKLPVEKMVTFNGNRLKMKFDLEVAEPAAADLSSEGDVQ